MECFECLSFWNCNEDSLSLIFIPNNSKILISFAAMPVAEMTYESLKSHTINTIN